MIYHKNRLKVLKTWLSQQLKEKSLDKVRARLWQKRLKNRNRDPNLLCLKVSQQTLPTWNKKLDNKILKQCL